MDRERIENELAKERFANAEPCLTCDGSGTYLGSTRCWRCGGSGMYVPPLPALINKVEIAQGWADVSGTLARATGAPPGSWIAIRLCDEGEDRTFLGVYLGELPYTPVVSVDSHVIVVRPKRNPAIWVQDLKRIVWGFESWWSIIKSPADLKQITDVNIQDTWYVRALQDLSGDTPEQDPEAFETGAPPDVND